jgi:hypothetical protein
MEPSQVSIRALAGSAIKRHHVRSVTGEHPPSITVVPGGPCMALRREVLATTIATFATGELTARSVIEPASEH